MYIHWFVCQQTLLLGCCQVSWGFLRVVGEKRKHISLTAVTDKVTVSNQTSFFFNNLNLNEDKYHICRKRLN